MRIIHTADWHLGKNLEGMSRIEEQEKFLDFFVDECNKLRPDLILLAGDIYDTINPPAKAEKLFYDTLKKLSRGGECVTAVIAGNHDSPERLISVAPLASEHGIIMFGTLRTIVEVGDYGKHKVVSSGEGYVKLDINGEKINLIAVAYPSEKRLNEVFYKDEENDEDRAVSYGEKVKKIFDNLAEKLNEDEINLVMSHLFAFGSEPTGSERSSSLGGSFLVSTNVFPEKADYVALGHIHKPQILPNTQGNVRYSGSPIHYNKSEINITKQFYVIDFDGKNKEITSVEIPVFKKIEVWKENSIEDAIKKCEDKKEEDSWVYIEIKTDRYIKDEEIKQMKSHKNGILEIIPIIDNIENSFDIRKIEELSFEEQFAEFYKSQKNVEATEELINLLKEILEEEENETDKN